MPNTVCTVTSCSGRHDYTLTEFPGPVFYELCRPHARELAAAGRAAGRCILFDGTSPSLEML